jgi:hypothetical protein
MPISEIMLGPSYNVFSKVGTAVDMSATIMSMGFSGEEISDEALATLKDSWFSLASGYSNYLKMRAIQNHGAWVDKFGMPISADLTASETEAMFAGMFGLQSADVREFYAANRDVMADAESLKEDGVAYAEQVMGMFRQTATGDRRNDWKNLRHMFEANRAFLGTLDEKDQEIVIRSAQNHLRKMYERGDSRFVDYMTKLIMGNSLGDSGRARIEEGMRDGVFTQDQGEALLRIDDMRFGE